MFQVVLTYDAAAMEDLVGLTESQGFLEEAVEHLYREESDEEEERSSEAYWPLMLMWSRKLIDRIYCLQACIATGMLIQVFDMYKREFFIPQLKSIRKDHVKEKVRGYAMRRWNCLSEE